MREGGYLVLRRSPWASAAAWVPEWWWAPMAFIGAVLQHAGSYITFAGWLLRWRGYYHASWARRIQAADWHEYTPDEDHALRDILPLWFPGHWRPVDVMSERGVMELLDRQANRP